MKSKTGFALQPNRKCGRGHSEIGGTVGDIETSLLGAIRQIKYDVGKENVMYIHVTSFVLGKQEDQDEADSTACANCEDRDQPMPRVQDSKALNG